MKKISIIMLVAATVSVFALNVYSYAEKKAISDSVLRLHIVAQSDSEYDQRLKLLVRDVVIEEAKDIFRKAGTKKEAVEIAEKNIHLLKKIAEKELQKEGCNLKVTIEVGKAVFPLKMYDNIRLPGGLYDSVNIKIGEAKGKNWWCIMYPMLCFSDSISGKLDTEGERVLKEELGEERFRLITDTEDRKIKIKFKILEIF